MITDQLTSFWEDVSDGKSPEEREKYYSRAENRVALELQIRGEKHIRQYPIQGYFADFYFPSLNLVLEIDGYYHSSSEQIKHDNLRDELMNKWGYTVVRVSGKLAMKNPASILDSIRLFPKARTFTLGSGSDVKYLQQLSVGIIPK